MNPGGEAMKRRPALFLVAIFVFATAAGLQAEGITCDGVLGNSGEQGATLVRFPGTATSGMGVVCDRYGSLWDRGGTALNRYAADGRLLASYKLPNTQMDRNSDTIALLGDMIMLRLGGELYALSIDAPAGAEIQPLKIPADRLSFSSHDGRLAASKGPEVFLVNAAGEKRPVATLEKSPNAVEIGPDGVVYVELDWKLFRVAVDGTTRLEPTGSFPGERPQFLDGYWYGSAWHSTERRFDKELKPAPGVVLGGNSGAFIGHVDEQSEVVNGRGLARLRTDLFAVSGFGGVVHLLAWKPAEKRFEPIRRIGALPACEAIGLDGEGRVWCGSGQWNWSDGPTTPQRLGIPAPDKVFGLATLDNGFLCGYGLQWGKPAILFGDLDKEPRVRRIESQTALPKEAVAAAVADIDSRRALVLLERDGRAFAVEVSADGSYKGDIGPVQFATASPVKAWTSLTASDKDTLLAAGDGFVIRFARDGRNWREDRRWNSSVTNGQDGKDTFGDTIRLAADAGRLWIADTKRSRVLCFDHATGKQIGSFGVVDSPGDDFAHLSAPTTLAARGDRAVVYDSGNQRLVKLRLAAAAAR
jgi:sugar lactone lactonase YvrE